MHPWLKKYAIFRHVTVYFDLTFELETARYSYLAQGHFVQKLLSTHTHTHTHAHTTDCSTWTIKVSSPSRQSVIVSLRCTYIIMNIRELRVMYNENATCEDAVYVLAEVHCDDADNNTTETATQTRLLLQKFLLHFA